MDKSKMKRHFQRKYPCNSIGIVSKEKIIVKKIDQITEEELKNDVINKINYKIDEKTDKLTKI
jgi:hypothetical protein